MSRIDVTTADIDIFDAPATASEHEDFEAEAREPAPGGHGLTRFLRRVWALPNGVKIGGSIVGFFILVAIFAPVLAPYGPQEGELADRLQSVGIGRAPARHRRPGPRPAEPPDLGRPAVVDRRHPAGAVRRH